MTTPVIKVKELNKVYFMGNTRVNALQSITLDISRNDYVALMGPSGSGKSTLMNLLGCLDSPTGGDYLLNGTNVSSMGDADLAEVRNRQIGFVFQTFNLLPRMTALENVALPLVYGGLRKSRRIERATEVLEAVGLGDRMDHKPNELSGGQRQRVAIARALVNHPSIILADEPTGNLDSKTSYEIMEILGRIHADGNTIVLVTHEHDISQYAHRIIRLKDGLVESDEANPNPIHASELTTEARGE
jgi:putative ABC transport system ATP-binding protein